MKIEYTTQIQTIAKYLQSNANKEFTVRQLAEWLVENYPEMAEAKRNNTNRDLSGNKLTIQVAKEIVSKRKRLRKYSNSIYWTLDSPIKLSYKSTELEKKQTDAESKTESKAEKDLYPLLSKFILEEFDVFSKRINESKSNKSGKGYNKWLHPDIVGMQPLFEDIEDDEVKKCISNYSMQNKFSLWSFEVKKDLNQSNLRESFFQTVSNSSWANNAYLVTGSDIADDIMEDLSMLCNLHGIGVIELITNTEAEVGGRIIIACKSKKTVDWKTIDRIAKANPDFKKYVELINKYCHNNKIIEEPKGKGWEEYPTEED